MKHSFFLSFVCSLLSSLALLNNGSASENWTMEWGTLARVESSPSVIRCTINNTQSDLRLLVPNDVPEISRVVDEMGKTLSAFVEYSPTSSNRYLVIDKSFVEQGLSDFLLETVEKSEQHVDGRIVLSAADAKLEGKSIQLETNPNNHRIGFWSNASDTVSWQFPATRWGMYRVLLTYSTASPAGSDIYIQVGKQKLTRQLESTSDWYKYRTLDFGKVYLAESGNFDVVVGCDAMKGNALMNLKAITLLPACEGEMPEQAIDGSIVLHGKDSIVQGTMLRYEPNPKKITLGYWIHTADKAVWQFSVTQPGKFAVEVWQGCGTNQGGSDAEVRLGDQVLTFVVDDTGHFQNFVPRMIGQIEINHSGMHELSIQPTRIAAQAAMDIRQIRLLPVTE